MIGLLRLVEMGAGARSQTDKVAISGSDHATRSESDPHGRSGRRYMLPLVLIGLRSG